MSELETKSPATVGFVQRGAVGEIVLNRPEKMNALDEPMVAAFRAALDQAEAAQVRALIVRGEGRAFCAGRDLATVDVQHDDAHHVLAEIFNPLLLRIAGFPVPTFAAVHGVALGAGLGIALACDVVYVADDAKVGSPFGKIGAVLDSGGHWYLTQRLGAQRALELIFSGRMLDGQEAARLGLVSGIFPTPELLERTRALAAATAAGPTAAFRESKELVRAIERDRLGFVDVLAREAEAQGRAARTEDYREGISAFQEKRAPRFRGR